MSPSTYYCWLVGRLYTLAWQRRRLPPAHQPLPALFLLAVPAVATVVVVGLMWLAVGAAMLANGSSLGDLTWRIDRMVWILLAMVVGSFGFATALISWLVWNQRAKRLQLAGNLSPEAPTPPDWTLRCSLGFVYFGVFSMLTPLILLGCLENLMGARTWKATQETLLARGEHLTIETIVPGPVPAEQNFCSIPEIQALFKDPTTGEPPTAEKKKELFRNFQLPNYALRGRTLPNGRTDPSPTPLRDWAEAFRIATGVVTNTRSITPANDQVLAERYGLALGSANKQPKTYVETLHKPKELPDYRVAPAESNDATAIATGMSIADAEFERIAEALHRPYSRFPLRWNDGFNALLPHLEKLKMLQQWVELRTRVHLAQGNLDQAFADAQTAIRLSNIVRDEPLLISQLVLIAQHSIAARTIDFGILSHQWSEPQLKEFQNHFAKASMLGAIADSFEGERAIALSTFDKWCSRPSEPETPFTDDQPRLTIPGLGGVRIPGATGLIRHNQATLANYYSLMIRSARATQEAGFRNGYHQELKSFEEKMDTSIKTLSTSLNPYSALTRQLLPAISKAVAKAVRAEQRARLTSTACAVERFYKRHGNYPASLDELVPEFVPEVPIDIMDRKPLRYRRNADATFILWSIGENGQDDGGVFKNPDKKKGDEILDWVWPN
jgi:hypothetical protein